MEKLLSNIEVEKTVSSIKNKYTKEIFNILNMIFNNVFLNIDVYRFKSRLTNQFPNEINEENYKAVIDSSLKELVDLKIIKLEFNDQYKKNYETSNQKRKSPSYGSDRNMLKKEKTQINLCDTHVDGA